MGTRFATTQESPLHNNIKQKIITLSAHDTIYGKNFDGIYARVMSTPLAEKSMKSPMNPIKVLIEAFSAAKLINLPLWKILPGLLLKYDKIYPLASYGAATKKLIAATVDGDLINGVQFIGQSQGLIHDIPFVQELIDRIINEAYDAHHNNHKLLNTQS